MAVIVKYTVVREGKEMASFTTKAEADKHDAMLNASDRIFELLETTDNLVDENKLEDLSIFLAKHKEELLIALGAKRAPKPKKKTTIQDKKSTSDAIDSDSNAIDLNSKVA